MRISRSKVLVSNVVIFVLAVSCGSSSGLDAEDALRAATELVDRAETSSESAVAQKNLNTALPLVDSSHRYRLLA